MDDKISTTGDLRKFLASAAKSVLDGTLPTERAMHIHKLSTNITNSLYLEAKIGSLQKDLGREVAKFGQLSIE